jgi:hypothetical protein
MTRLRAAVLFRSLIVGAISASEIAKCDMWQLTVLQLDTMRHPPAILSARAGAQVKLRHDYQAVGPIYLAALSAGDDNSALL